MQMIAKGGKKITLASWDLITLRFVCFAEDSSNIERVVISCCTNSMELKQQTETDRVFYYSVCVV